LKSSPRLKSHHVGEEEGKEGGGYGGLNDVSHVVAVYSCKGGVGKSTVTVNLASALSSLGLAVGICDLDLYGPSLPSLVTPTDPTVKKDPENGNMIQPLLTGREGEGGKVKVISLGYVSPSSGVPGSGVSSDAAVMRGPMASSVTKQLLKGV